MKYIWHNICLSLLLTLTLFMLATGITYAQVAVINMIPNAQSGETNQDSEPNIAVNMANILQIAGSAFTPDPGGGANAPIYVSTDGGNTWLLNSIVPSQAGSVAGTGDITLRFSGTSSILYAAILRRPGNFRLNILRTNNFTGAAAMTILVDRNNVDQPYIQATTVLGGAGVNNDRIYIGNNDFAAPGGRTATIDRSLNAATAPAPAGIGTFRIETRATAGQDGPPIRPAIHPNGTVYGVFYRWTNIAGNSTLATITTDVVVVRDDNWGAGATPFTDLVDAGDGNAGVRVVQNRTVPWANVSQAAFGQERFVGSNITIAVDPRNSATVYIAWADRVGATDHTLHVRRSINSGANWSADLRTITNAINPALTINSRGRVGFLYQQLTGTGTAQRWVTHLERTNNAFTAVNDLVLATVPANAPASTFLPYIGDYVHLMAVGKNFYGIFSANNTPNNANFPNNVTYQRNANFGTNTLLNTNNITPVNVSIDPFFVRVTELAANSDFYVSDWTNTPASRDTGLEPSTNPVFYITSDVWNRRSNAPAAFNANDQPSSQNPQMVSAGKNYAFARIKRNATGGAAAVTAHFLFSEFGTGSNYQDAGVTPDPTINFAAADLVQTMASGYEWELPVTTSTHTCLAVEITAPGDPFVAPSVLGSAPGWPTTDLMFINDNNKAQRNMGVYQFGGTGTVSLYAVIHNAALYRRMMIIRYAVAREVQKRLPELRVWAIGGKDESYQFGNSITLANMEPGENRWIELTFDVPGGSDGKILPVIFEEMVDNTAVNGFAIAAQPSPMSEVIRENLEFHSEVLIRIAAAFGIRSAEEEGRIALKLSRVRRIPAEEYVKLVQSHIRPMSEYLLKLIDSHKSGDPFDIRNSIAFLSRELRAGDVNSIAPAHATVLHKFDAFLTMLQKSKGDTADILQNVRWQKYLCLRVPQLEEMGISKLLLEKSQKFIIGYSNRKFGNDAYPEFIQDLMDSFQMIAEALSREDLKFEQDMEEMERSLGSPAALQKAHRGYLLKLQSLAK